MRGSYPRAKMAAPGGSRWFLGIAASLAFHAAIRLCRLAYAEVPISSLPIHGEKAPVFIDGVVIGHASDVVADAPRGLRAAGPIAAQLPVRRQKFRFRKQQLEQLAEDALGVAARAVDLP